MQVQDIKFCEVLQVSNPLNVIFTKHQNSESGHCVQVWDLFDRVVVKIKENKSGQWYQIFNFWNVIVLQVQETKAFFSFKKRHMRKVSFIQIKPIWVGVSLTRLPIYDQNAWNLWELSKNNFILIFNSSNDTIFEQISVPFIFFIAC